MSRNSGRRPARKPGGQLNNLNAFKHGFYSRFSVTFPSPDCGNRNVFSSALPSGSRRARKRGTRLALSSLPPTDLDGELALLRINLERFLQSYAAALDTLDYEQRLFALRAVTLAVARAAALQRLLSASGKDPGEMQRLRALLDLPEDQWDRWLAGSDLAPE